MNGASTGRALVVHPALKSAPGQQPAAAGRLIEARLEEAVGLARAIRLDIVCAEIARLTRPRPSYLLGRGTLENLGELISENAVGVVVLDGVLSPVQQRNLERRWQTKVIDRTGLILEIFGARARTYEGRLQVELAALSYQRSRLVRSWTHLERQRGGLVFLVDPARASSRLTVG